MSSKQSLNGFVRHRQPNKKMEAVSKPTESQLEDGDKTNTGTFLACFFGIFGSYFIYGILQEKITKSYFEDEQFRYFIFLVFFQCIINAIIAKTVSWYRHQTVAIVPYSLFGLVSLSYVGAMVCSNAALAYVTYPTQVLGKSAKPIPVMILGVLISKRKYTLIKYLCVLTIVFGVGLFLYKDVTHKELQVSYKLFDTIGIGELLLFISLTLDGVTGAIQDKLRALHSTSALHMMYAINCYASAYLLIGLVATGEGINAVGFISRHPVILFNLFAFSMASAIGQIFIFTTITTFGPLTCAVITTTRKFFTILASVILFGNSLLTRQWIAVILVFTGLGLDAYYGKRRKTNTVSQTQSA